MVITRLIPHRLVGTAFLLAATVASAQPSKGPARPNIDPKADQVLHAVSNYYGGLKSFRVEADMTMALEAAGVQQKLTSRYTVGMQRPSRLAIIGKEGKLGATILCDGKGLLIYVPALRRYMLTQAPETLDTFWEQRDMKALGTGLGSMILVESLVHSHPYEKLVGRTSVLKYIGQEKLSGVSCHRIKVSQKPFDYEFWVATDGSPVVRKVVADMSKTLRQAAAQQPGLGSMKMEITVRFAQWESNPDLPDRMFAAVPPQGAQRVQSFVQSGPPRHPLVGKEAPNFTLSRLTGGTVELASHRGKDVVILDFWATWCGPCVQALPILSRVVADYKKKGVVFYAVNKAENARTISAFLKRRNLDLPVVLDRSGAVGGKYMASSIPQTVLIDRDGKVQVVHVGFGPGLGQRLRRELDAILAGKDLSGSVGQ